MMKYTVFKYITLILFCSLTKAQYIISGKIINEFQNETLNNVELTLDNKERIYSDEKGNFFFKNVKKGKHTILFYRSDFKIEKREFDLKQNINIEIYLKPIISLNPIEAKAQKKKAFDLRRMKNVEGTSILAGKKTEVVLVDQLTANLATNNARQIYSQVVGLNIFDYNDGGLQLGIGGRGLNPNRTANFNTRQNGYDISADVLGYPESYYTPASEALKEIQIIRGAASLQYGTQFGGLVNFILKKPNSYKKFEFISRNSTGSNHLFTSFNSISGTSNKIGYYGYYNHKQGNSFRPNSHYKSHNFFAHVDYQFSKKTKLQAEFTHFEYLAQQPGGLTDYQFSQNPNYSNRNRNWFDVNWNLMDLNFSHVFKGNAAFSTHFFGLKASRKALGFRVNRISQEDEPGSPRDLIIGNFNNWAIETRYLQPYNFAKKENVFLLGAKYYHANNSSQQGPGSTETNANFEFDTATSPDYPYQSFFDYPNRNLAIFGENIFNVNPQLTITPGFRWEWINTKADGYFKHVILDLAGNPILNNEVEEKKKNKRSLLLLGLGLGYKINQNVEMYSNLSQNYRSVTFSDIHTLSPSFKIAEDITDEKGYSFDLGLRGNFKNIVSYDTNLFTLYYNQKIGEFINNEGLRERDNIGTAIVYGLEMFIDLGIDELIDVQFKSFDLNLFVNASFLQSEYLKSKITGVNGNKVELAPDINLKTGINIGYRNFSGQWLFTYLSKQFTDAANTPLSTDPINGGILGEIPAYSVMDLSASYQFKKIKLETSINNLLNKYYFVRRASGYPGPGIIPSEPRNITFTLEIKL